MNHKVSYEVSVTGNGEQGFKRITKASAETRRSIAGTNKDLERTKKLRDETTDPRRLHSLNAAIRETETEIRKAEGSTNALGLSMGKLKVAGVAAATAVSAGIYKTGKAAITASSQMEKYQVTLKTMLVSTKAAGERMAEYVDIAKITPFQLREVVEGGNQLQAMGRYSRENLEMLGDLAAASSKPLQQALGAYGKLASGQKGIAVDMFRDLLITTNDWVEATGKGVDKSGQLKASVEDMMKALPKIMEKKGFMGLMAAQAETTEGKMSNLEDAVFSLSDAIGERMQPTVKSVVGWLSKLTGKMEDAVRIPTTQKLAAEKVELNFLVERLAETNEGEDERNRLMQELNMKYPEFLKNIDLEKGGMDALIGKLKEANAEYDRRIKKAVYAKRIEALEGEAAEAMDTVAKYELSNFSKQEYARLQGEFEKQAKAEGYETNGYGRITPEMVQNGSIGGRKLSPTLQGMYDEMAVHRGNMSWRNDAKQIAKAEEEYNRAKKQMEVIERAMENSIGSTDEGTAGDGNGGGQKQATTSGGSAGYGGGSGIGGGTSGGGGGGGRSVTTKIGTLVGVININTTNLTEGAAEIKRLVAQALTEAIPSN